MAEFVTTFFLAYFALGALFAAAFVSRGAVRLNPAVHGAPLAVRLLLLPGATALWPLLLWKWIRGSR